MAYTQTDLTNQQIAVAEAQLATVTANNALTAARGQLQLIQATIAVQNAQAAAVVAPPAS